MQNMANPGKSPEQDTCVQTSHLVKPGPILRSKQRLLVSAAQEAFRNGHQAVLMQAPTGFGKTVVLAHIANLAAAAGKQVLIVAHRRELIRQASRKLRDAGVAHGVIAPGFIANGDPVQLPPYDLIILDECHHAVAGQWSDLLTSQPDAYVLGVTATPERLDGRGSWPKSGWLLRCPGERPLLGRTDRGRIFSPPPCLCAADDHRSIEAPHSSQRLR